MVASHLHNSLVCDQKTTLAFLIGSTRLYVPTKVSTNRKVLLSWRSPSCTKWISGVPLLSPTYHFSMDLEYTAILVPPFGVYYNWTPPFTMLGRDPYFARLMDLQFHG
jgi:hypothetical protein